jgi:hypothetical protein
MPSMARCRASARPTSPLRPVLPTVEVTSLTVASRVNRPVGDEQRTGFLHKRRLAQPNLSVGRHCAKAVLAFQSRRI